MPKFTTAQRLKQILEERNLKQIDIINLAKPYCNQYDVKLGRNDLSQYLSGKVVPKQNKTYVLAKALNVNEAWLMGYDIPKERNDEPEIAIGTPYNPIIHKIPVLGYISAGLPLYADEHIIDYTYTERNGGAEYFALKVKGDSMSAAHINDGDTLIVRRQNVVENGEIAVVLVDNNDATVKRYRQDGTNVQLIPQSFNPEHEIQFYNLKYTKINIIGKVVECKTEF